MNTLTYNGYTGSVEFSEEDNVFFGKLEGINALVNYEGESVIVTPEIHNTIARLAHKNGISINAFVNSAIEKQISVFA